MASKPNHTNVVLRNETYDALKEYRDASEATSFNDAVERLLEGEMRRREIANVDERLERIETMLEQALEGGESR